MCDTLVAVRPGRVLFAKNSDRDPNEAQVLDWQPRRDHPAGTRLWCTRIVIDQVRTTYAVLLSRPFWMWGAEMGANEHGVVIGNEAVFTDQPYAPTGLTRHGPRAAGPRAGATTAEGAVDVIIDLLGRYGQGGGCSRDDPGFTYHNSYIVADPTGAFVVETAGELWAVEQVTSGVRSISNGLTIPGFADHGDRVRTWYAQARKRRARTGACPADSVGDLMSVLRPTATRGPNPVRTLHGSEGGALHARRRGAEGHVADHRVLGGRARRRRRPPPLGDRHRGALHRGLPPGARWTAPRPGPEPTDRFDPRPGGGATNCSIGRSCPIPSGCSPPTPPIATAQGPVDPRPARPRLGIAEADGAGGSGWPRCLAPAGRPASGRARRFWAETGRRSRACRGLRRPPRGLSRGQAPTQTDLRLQNSRMPWAVSSRP